MTFVPFYVGFCLVVVGFVYTYVDKYYIEETMRPSPPMVYVETIDKRSLIHGVRGRRLKSYNKKSQNFPSGHTDKASKIFFLAIIITFHTYIRTHAVGAEKATY